MKSQNLFLAFAIIILSSTTAVLAQEQTGVCDAEGIKTDYENLTANYKATNIDALNSALASAKKVKEICKASTDELLKPQLNFVDRQLVALQGKILQLQFNAAASAAMKSKDYAASYTLAKEILTNDARFKNNVDLKIYAARAAYAASSKANGTDPVLLDAIKMMGEAIAQIEGGAKSTDWGLYDLVYKVTTGDSRDNALAGLHFTIGELKFEKTGEKAEAVKYFVKATTFPGADKDFIVRGYFNIGTYYGEFFKKNFDEANAKYKANGEKDTDETILLYGTAKAYADRAMDAYGRALQVLGTDDKDAAASLESTIANFYKFRFDGKTEGQKEYVATLLANPMPDPSSEIVPVKEETPAAPAPTVPPAPITPANKVSTKRQ